MSSSPCAVVYFQAPRTVQAHTGLHVASQRSPEAGRPLPTCKGSSMPRSSGNPVTSFCIQPVHSIPEALWSPTWRDCRQPMATSRCWGAGAWPGACFPEPRSREHKMQARLGKDLKGSTSPQKPGKGQKLERGLGGGVQSWLGRRTGAQGHGAASEPTAAQRRLELVQRALGSHGRV